MSIQYSQYLWGFEVFDSGSAQNNKLDFIDAGTAFTATLNTGVYTPDEAAAEVQRAMRAANTGNQNNTCSFSYSTLLFTVTGTATFTLKWSSGTNAAVSCHGLLGFSSLADKSGSASYNSDAAAGTSPSSASLWTAAEPLAYTSPISAQPFGTAAQLSQRSMRSLQHVTDGMTCETIYFGTLKSVQLAFKALLSTEQTKMESFLDWITQGKRFTWQPDKTSSDGLKLVLAAPGSVADFYEWLARPEITYGTLTFYEQLS